HQHSLRSEDSLVAVNMGGISETLFESEMFGHVKGAFTDAKESRVGRFELAHQGTLFLDEIANVPLTQQAKLLRVLEAKQFEKVGSSSTRATDFRLISATNGDLLAMVNAGEFRQDLMFRINTLILKVPALRDRQEDIIPLANDFIKQIAIKYHKPAVPLSAKAQQSLLDYHWPGNVRELAHTMERALLVASDVIEPQHLMLNLQSQHATMQTKMQVNFDNSDLSLLEIERGVISQRLKSFAGNAKEAGDSLGLTRSAFYRRLEKLGL
ncbi:MAG: DNA-binding NtrC family response regulator, partial [Psychromonas sp.]|uniref:sigma 54-interacting transcriptional regulator n=1 Tax=Psychromonas sp. TaxID=1884585 RepID=UPI0039E32371